MIWLHDLSRPLKYMYGRTPLKKPDMSETNIPLITIGITIVYFVYMLMIICVSYYLGVNPLNL